jgi:prophage antirepressor-like protein
MENQSLVPEANGEPMFVAKDVVQAVDVEAD